MSLPDRVTMEQHARVIEAMADMETSRNRYIHAFNRLEKAVTNHIRDCIDADALAHAHGAVMKAIGPNPEGRPDAHCSDCPFSDRGDWVMYRDEYERLVNDRDRAIETRENANTVSVRVEGENRRLKEALQLLADDLGLENAKFSVRVAVRRALDEEERNG